MNYSMKASKLIERCGADLPLVVCLDGCTVIPTIKVGWTHTSAQSPIWGTFIEFWDHYKQCEFNAEELGLPDGMDVACLEGDFDENYNRLVRDKAERDWGKLTLVAAICVKGT